MQMKLLTRCFIWWPMFWYEVTLLLMSLLLLGWKVITYAWLHRLLCLFAVLNSHILLIRDFLSCLWITHTHPFNGPLSRITQVSRYQKSKINLDFTEVSGNGIGWAICKSAPRSRQVTTPAPHHSYELDNCYYCCQPWRWHQWCIDSHSWCHRCLSSTFAVHVFPVEF